MSSSPSDYSVRVSPIFLPHTVKKSLSTSSVEVVAVFCQKYQPDTTSGTVIEFQCHVTDRTFKFPCHSLTSDDASCSSNVVSEMICNLEDNGFPLDRLTWKTHAKESFTPVPNREDLAQKIVEYARTEIGGVAGIGARPFKALSLRLSFVKDMILPQQEFEALVMERAIRLRNSEQDAMSETGLEEEVMYDSDGEDFYWVANG